MSFLDYVLIALVAALFVLAFCLQRRKPHCGGSCGCCSCCEGCGKKKAASSCKKKSAASPPCKEE